VTTKKHTRRGANYRKKIREEKGEAKEAGTAAFCKGNRTSGREKKEKTLKFPAKNVAASQALNWV